MSVISPLRRSVLVSLLISIFAPGGPVAGAPSPISANLLDQILGKWLITAFDIAPISAVTAEEANSFIGKWAEFQPDRVTFGDLKCGEPVYKEITSSSPESGDTDIIIDCKANGIVPNLSYNQHDRRLVAELDGATYHLSRNP
jgi:hypothetical protein